MRYLFLPPFCFPLAFFFDWRSLIFCFWISFFILGSTTLKRPLIPGGLDTFFPVPLFATTYCTSSFFFFKMPARLYTLKTSNKTSSEVDQHPHTEIIKILQSFIIRSFDFSTMSQLSYFIYIFHLSLFFINMQNFLLLVFFSCHKKTKANTNARLLPYKSCFLLKV